MLEFGACSGFGGVGWAADLGLDGVNGGVELVDIGDLDPVVLSDDPDGGGLGDADALTEGVVCLDFGGE